MGQLVVHRIVQEQGKGQDLVLDSSTHHLNNGNRRPTVVEVITHFRHVVALIEDRVVSRCFITRFAF